MPVFCIKVKTESKVRWLRHEPGQLGLTSNKQMADTWHSDDMGKLMRLKHRLWRLYEKQGYAFFIDEY